MSIKTGAIVVDGQEHQGSIALFMALMSSAEVWLDTVTDIRSMGIILNEHTWAFGEYVLPDAPFLEPTVSIQSFAREGEQHFSKSQFKQIIQRCRDLAQTPEAPNHDCLVFWMTPDKFWVMTVKSSDGALKNPSTFYPLSTTVGYQNEVEN